MGFLNRSYSFFTPDDIVSSDDEKTFLYTAQEGLYLGKKDEIHPDVANREPYYSNYVKRHGTSPPDRPTNDALVGRVAHFTDILGEYPEHKNKHVVAFWNGKPSEKMFRTLLPACLKELKSRGLINNNTYISTVFTKEPIPYSQFLKQGLSDFDASNQDKLDAAPPVHLLRGNEKRQALLKQGATPKLNPWKDHLTPGQKHWAMASESFKEWLKDQH